MLRHFFKFPKGGILMVSSKKALLVSCCFFFFAAFLLPLNHAYAAGGLELSTRYPGISATAGENITFPLEIKNKSNIDQVINLDISSKPENWTSSLKGIGREIQQVYVAAQDYSTADLKIRIPEDTKPGNYLFTLTAISESGLKDNLKLIIKIANTRKGDDELVAKYSELKGPSDATFNFKLDLTNNGTTEQIYSLGALIKDGWQVSFKPSYENQQVASIGVKPGETKGLDVKVQPPVNIKAGEYTIPVYAVSPAGKVSEELKIIISGTYDLELTTPSGRLNAEIVAGKEQKVNLEVNNNGSATLNNINFSSREPNNWSVTFDPKTIDTLKPGESRQVTATITADGNAIAGDYLVSVSASTQETRDTAELRVTVKTSTLWGIVGVFIILLVIFAVYKVFQTYGRR